MNNTVFDKTLESLQKHQNVKLVPKGRKFKKLVSKPIFKSFKIFSEDLVGIHMSKTEKNSQNQPMSVSLYSIYQKYLCMTFTITKWSQDMEVKSCKTIDDRRGQFYSSRSNTRCLQGHAREHRRLRH